MDQDLISLNYYNQALTLGIKRNAPVSIASIYNQMGDIYYKLNKNDKARSYYTKGMFTYNKANNLAGTGNSLAKLGNTYFYSSNYDIAIDYYLKALSIFEKIKDQNGIAKVYNNIGSLYTILGDNKLSLSFLEKARQIYAESNDIENLSDVYFRIGETMIRLKDYESALNYFNKAKSIFDSLHIQRKSAYIDRCKAKIAFHNGNVLQAIALAQNALGIFNLLDYNWAKAEVYNDLATYYLNTKDFNKAQTYIWAAIATSKNINSIELLKTNYLTLSEYYAAQNDFKQSLLYYKTYQQLNDSVINREKNTRIAELHAKYEASQKEELIQEKNKLISNNYNQIKRQQFHIYLFGGGIIIILMLSLILYWQYRLVKIKGRTIERINSELDLRVKKRTLELRLAQFSIEQAADPIFWIDPIGRFIYANNSACMALDYSKDELLSLKITDIIPKFTYSDWVDFWEITRKEGSLVVETTFRKKTNVNYPVELNLNYICHDDKEYAFAFVHDISDRKQKEENLKKAKEKAEEADKLKSAFLANMSHEIRTPMNAIIGFSEMLLNEEFTSDEKIEFASIVRSSGDTLLKLIDDIIDISLIEAGQLRVNMSAQNLSKLLKEIYLFFQGELKRLNKNNVELILNENSFRSNIYVQTDPIRFRQVITNLIGNALKFTESGFIEIGCIDQNPEMLTIYIKDTGIGIPKEKIPLIFKRFQKLNDDKKLYRGTGLGLTISKKLVEQMGGELSVESQYGSGSTFLFSMLYNEKESPKSNKSISNNNKFSWENKSILIVEDVESNYLFLKTALKKTKAIIHWAQNDCEAMDYCNKQRPDIILMDIQLPGKNGYEISKEILDIYPGIPVVAQTAYAFDNEKDKIMEAGCIDYISKPINTEILFEILHKYIQ
jgi:PAS domain S-box